MKKTRDQHLLNISSKPMAFRLVWAYYIATPLFFIMELLWGISLRVPVLLAVPLRYVYYLFCFVCGAICYFRPRVTPVIGLIESTVNIALVFLGFLAAIIATWNVDRTTTTPAPEALPLKDVLSFAIIATVWIISFHHSLRLVQEMTEQKRQS
jgi:hypothetical protein